MIAVEQASEVTAELVEAVGRLLPQLSSSAGSASAGDLTGVVSSSGSILYVAKDGSGEIVGMLTLVTYRIPTGLRAVIEDVVVDEAARGSGAGSALVDAALEEAARRGVPHVDLTSRPSRDSANRLYLKMGFERRETNVYRYSAQ